MVSYLISGASRGLGLAMAERLAQTPGNIIYAGARSPESASSLKDAADKAEGRIQLIQLDTADDASVKAAIQTLEEKEGALDVLINNAGTALGGWAGPLELNLEQMASNFNVNVLGVARLTNAALPLMRKSEVRQIFVISSQMGTPGFCIKGNMAMGSAYGPTKSAATTLTVHYAIALKEEGFTVVPVHPGWVRTEMGGEGGDISVEESIDGLVKVFASAKKGDDIALISYDGKKLAF